MTEEVTLKITSLQVITPGPSPHYRSGNPGALKAIEKVASEQGLAIETGKQPRRIEWLPAPGKEFDVPQHLARPPWSDRGTVHHIPPEGAQEVIEWLTIAAGGATAMAVFIRNVLGALVDFQKLDAEDLTFEVTYRGETLRVKPGQDIEPLTREIDRRRSEEP